VLSETRPAPDHNQHGVLTMTEANHIAEATRNAIVDMLHRKQFTPAARAVQNMVLPIFDEPSTFEQPGSTVPRGPSADDPRQRRTLSTIAAMR